ncbi:MAG: hypothetical protein LC808_25705 [Actinobacteria bacterium]|nr:hypothetical protein [Actinomycetota bacterium]
MGNLYKTEVCFLLGVSPWSPVSAVDPAAVVALARQLLLRNAGHPQQSTTGELRRGAQHWAFERTGRAWATLWRSRAQRDPRQCRADRLLVLHLPAGPAPGLGAPRAPAPIIGARDKAHRPARPGRLVRTGRTADQPCSGCDCPCG